MIVEVAFINIKRSYNKNDVQASQCIISKIFNIITLPAILAIKTIPVLLRNAPVKHTRFLALSLLKVRAKMSLDLMFLPINIDFCIVRTYSILKKFLTLINMAVLKTFLKVFISFLLMFHAIADPGWDPVAPCCRFRKICCGEKPLKKVIKP